MTREETKMIITILELAYPQHYSKIDEEHIIGQINLWSELWKDADANLIANTVKSMISGDVNPFPPTIGQINARASVLLNGNRMTEQEAWNYVKRALPNASVQAKYDWEKFPKEVQELCSPKDLVQWACYTDEKQVDTVIASNFMRSYREKVIQNKQQELLPNSVKLAISGIVESMRIENNADSEKEN